MQIGPYQIEDAIGEGGMGKVYAARDTRLDRRVALKILKPSRSAEGRTLREAQSLAALSHPNVVQIFEVGRYRGRLFFAMEHVPGKTLRQWQRARPDDWRSTLRLYIQAARGLAAAHAAGIVHRDFKPGNAIVGEDGRVRVLDFGLATARDSAVTLAGSTGPVTETPSPRDQLTRTGTFVGTPAYIAPEQTTGRVPDHRADQFSFCVALWEALLGVRPFLGGTLAARKRDVDRGRLVTPVRPRVPASVRAVVARGLRAKPDQRWPDMHRLALELEAAAQPARWRPAAIGVVVVAGLAAIALPHSKAFSKERAAERCAAEAGREQRALWDEGTAWAVREGLLGTGVGHAGATAAGVIPRLDAYAAAWAEGRAAVCRDRSASDGAWLLRVDRADWCLDERADLFAELVGELRTADPQTANEAVSAVLSLPAVEACTDPQALRHLPEPPEPGRRVAARAKRRLLGRVSMLRLTGRADKATDLLEEASLDAAALDSPELEAEARLQGGYAQLDRGAYNEAAAAFEDAYFVAATAGDLQRAAEASVQLLFVVSHKLGDHEAGWRWARHAEAALSEMEVGPQDVRRLEYLRMLSLIEADSGDWAEALSVSRQALRLSVEALGPLHPMVGHNHNSLGVLLWRHGDTEEALEHLERTTFIRDQTVGPRHPASITAKANLAGVMVSTGRLTEGAAILEETLATSEETLGPDTARTLQLQRNLLSAYMTLGREASMRALVPRVARAARAVYGDGVRYGEFLSVLSSVQYRLGEFEDAERLARECIAVVEPALGPDTVESAACLGDQANALAALGRKAEAIDTSLRSAAVWERAAGPDDERLGWRLANTAAMMDPQRDFDRMQPLYERALSILVDKLGALHPHTAGARYFYAEACIVQGRWEQARELIVPAIEAFESLDGIQRDEAMAYFAYARILARDPTAMQAAVALASRAYDVLARSDTASDDNRQELEQWLRRHRAPRRTGGLTTKGAMP